MPVHRLPDPDEAFDPRLAAQSHAGVASWIASRLSHEGDEQAEALTVLAELANAVACGLVYVGDRIAARPVAGADVVASAPDFSREVRAVTPCTLELDGERFELQAGDTLTVPGLRVAG